MKLRICILSFKGAPTVRELHKRWKVSSIEIGQHIVPQLCRNKLHKGEAICPVCGVARSEGDSEWLIQRKKK